MRYLVHIELSTQILKKNIYEMIFYLCVSGMVLKIKNQMQHQKIVTPFCLHVNVFYFPKKFSVTDRLALVVKNIVIGPGGLGVDSRVGQIGTVLPVARHRCDVFSDMGCSGAKLLRWAPATRFTLRLRRHNVAIKIWFEQNYCAANPCKQFYSYLCCYYLLLDELTLYLSSILKLEMTVLSHHYNFIVSMKTQPPTDLVPVKVYYKLSKRYCDK